MTENNTKTTPVSGLLGSLEQAGLEPNEAIIYEVLVVNGPLPAGKICQKTPLKRGLVYKVLEDLVLAGLVIKHDEPGKVAVFEPAHPVKLQELAEHKEKEAKQAQTALASVLPQLTSTFNLAVGKPGVQFYEGLEGARKVAFDNLSTSGEILAYVDIASIQSDFHDINEEYVKARRRLKITKRNLVSNTEENRKLLANYNRDITDVRLLNFSTSDSKFGTLMQIYDNKVSYITLDPKHIMSVIIEDAAIAAMHRLLYLHNWETAQPLSNLGV